jgi:N-acetylmuramoyl-L-alanine amidase
VRTSVAVEEFNSVERVITTSRLEPKFRIKVSDSDIDMLSRIVEAEAGQEDYIGKILVADVVINRVNSNDFPDSVTEVVFQKSNNITQFSPVSNGTIDRVTVSDDTVKAVYSALMGEDKSGGALYFMARKYSKPQNVEWFDNHLTYLYTHGGHDFYSE